ncbi:glycosyltransferase [Clostridium sp. SYSU_GA19001]|uniref:glycosyltransferase family 2 protein n=1 Tax=Clostridium caldaquaticum TaxID=2940653 RepID=UPI0020777722|nr:glycosyltransferase family 2 protein [Clostridium caldaquaticum]MCM8711260.1 glycosyltransferase [Clostridium caldaquaticum]
MTKIEASIIIPSFNRKDLLELSLYSFNKQDFMFDKFEVIIIDDGSNDGTADMVKSLNMNFPIKLIINEKNHGAAFCRNQGLKIARGNIIIFSDSDLIVPPNFVSGHVNYHTLESNLSICAVIRWKKIYSFYYESFNYNQKKEFESVRRSLITFNNKLKATNFDYQDNHRIICKDDLTRIEEYSFIPSWSDSFLGSLVKIFGNNLDNFQYPWLLFGTGNVSILKKHLLDAGGFDERFKRQEDWDLGYRLYKNSIKFKCALELESVHQEHKIVDNRDEINFNGYSLLLKKYTDPNLLMFILYIEGLVNLFTLSNASLGYSQLKTIKKFNPVIKKFNELLNYRINSYLNKKTRTDNFIDISNELILLNEVSHKYISFIKIFKELSRIYV